MVWFVDKPQTVVSRELDDSPVAAVYQRSGFLSGGKGGGVIAKAGGDAGFAQGSSGSLLEGP